MADLKTFQDILKQNSGGVEEVEKGPLQPPPLDPILRKPVDGKVPRSEQCCGNCDAHMQHPGNSMMWICTDEPPKPILLGMAQTKTLDARTGQPQQVPIAPAFWPVIEHPALWCRKWKLKAE